FVVDDLYSRRWRIEESFLLLKRLLGLSYLWTGSVNGIQLQIWATWLFYAVLIDLSDEVADELTLPFDSISIEMVFRGIYHFTQAVSQGGATDFIAYLTAPENRDLGIVKSPRPKRAKPSLDLSPFPA
ncbi:MAG: IS4 family transposase, partial [Cyanobacteria bacterium J06600_6]